MANSKLTSTEMLLFLDFDGVLHSINPCESDEFLHLPRLEAILCDYPKVSVVITSDWRLGESIDNIRNLFSEDIRARIIGVTPFRPEDETDLFRWAEINAWLIENGYVGVPFVILDDTRHLFPSAVEELIYCDPETGITDNIEHLLRIKLKNGK